MLWLRPRALAWCVALCHPAVRKSQLAGAFESGMGLFELRGYAITAWLRGSGVSGVPRMCRWCPPRCPPEAVALRGDVHKVGRRASLLPVGRLDRGILIELVVLLGWLFAQLPTQVRRVGLLLRFGARSRRFSCAGRQQPDRAPVEDEEGMSELDVGQRPEADDRDRPAGGILRDAAIHRRRGRVRAGCRGSRRRCP